MKKINWDICAYCKKTKKEVILEFCCIDGSICVECSDKWHRNNPKALSKKTTSILLKIYKSKKKIYRKNAANGKPAVC